MIVDLAALLLALASLQDVQGPPIPPPSSIQELPPETPNSTPLPPPREPEPQALERVLVLGPFERQPRGPIVVDPFLARVVRAALDAPAEGEVFAYGDGAELQWRELSSSEGRFEDPALRGGWAYARVPSRTDEEQVLLLEARGHSALYVDGSPRGGDPYETGLVRTPFVARPEGTDVYLRVGRGRLSATVMNPPAPIFLEDRDATLPDLVRGRLELLKGSVVVVNATNAVQPEVLVTCTAEFFGSEQQFLSTVRIPELLPLEVRKQPVPLPLYFEFDDGSKITEFTLIVSLHQVDPDDGMQIAMSQVRFPIRVRHPDEVYKTTYESHVDGSAQYYAVRQAVPPAEDQPAPTAIVLSLHGAGVEATAQAASYAPKDWCHIVAPTNRRPFGFDWEDWGRRDALDALIDARTKLGGDPARTYLTGHSMGGHGTWNMGALLPEVFAAAAPSAGWSDFWSYTGAWRPAEGDAVGALLARASNASRTGLLIENLAGRGVFVLHGDADDNVPVREARAMRERLDGFHGDFAYHEEPGAGHWWGNQCVDWPPLFDFLRQHTRPRDAEVLDVRLRVVQPAAANRLHWVVVEAQHRSLEPSDVTARLDPATRTIEITTDNVSRLLLDFSDLSRSIDGRPPVLAAEQPFKLRVDGQREIEAAWPPGATSARLWRRDPGGSWLLIGPVSAAMKSPSRCGPFKQAFDRDLIFLYATGGSPEENAWSWARARYDADRWAYRGNGFAQLMSDDLFMRAQPIWRGGRNVVIYGHSEMNKAWALLESSCPIEVRRGTVRVGGRSFARDDLAVLFTYPRKESAEAAAAVVCGSGPVGQRLTETLPYFTSGAAFPDWTVLSPQMLEQGSSGVLGAGFFDYNWSLERGDSAWREEPQPR